MEKKVASESVLAAEESFELIELATLDIEMLAKAFNLISDAAQAPDYTFEKPLLDHDKVILN